VSDEEAKSEAQTRERTKRSTSFAGEAEAANTTVYSHPQSGFSSPACFYLFHPRQHKASHHSRSTRPRRICPAPATAGTVQALLTLAESALLCTSAACIYATARRGPTLLLSIVAAERCHWLHDRHPPSSACFRPKDSSTSFTNRLVCTPAKCWLVGPGCKISRALLHSAFQPSYSSPSHWCPAPRSRCFSKSSSDCQYPGLTMTWVKLFQQTSTNHVHTHRVAGVCSISKPPGPFKLGWPREMKRDPS
jgi:hypothetical protein